MTTHLPDPGDLTAISPRSLRYYLEAQGWQRTGEYGDHAHVYGRTETNTELLVPRSSGLADYARRVHELLRFLSQLEERTPWAVLRDFSLAETDLIRVQLPEAHTGPSIPIADAALLLTEAQKLLGAAACSASKPQRAYRTGRNKAASDYLQTVHMGQTERGSFIINHCCPTNFSIVRVAWSSSAASGLGPVV